MNYCGCNIEPFCSDVYEAHRRPQTLAKICRNMSICCGFRPLGENIRGLSYCGCNFERVVTKHSRDWNFDYFWLNCPRNLFVIFIKVMTWCRHATTQYLPPYWSRFIAFIPLQGNSRLHWWRTLVSWIVWIEKWQYDIVWNGTEDIPSNLSYRSRQIPKLKCFSSRPVVVFAESIEASC